MGGSRRGRAAGTASRFILIGENALIQLRRSLCFWTGGFALSFATSAAAQDVRVAPVVGIVTPLAGTMVTWERQNPAAGVDSVPWAHVHQPGPIVGVAVEVDRPAGFDWSAQLTGTFSERIIRNSTRGERSCTCKTSLIVSAAVLARRTTPVTGSIRLLFGLGPELHYFAGDAVSNEDAFRQEYYVDVSPRVAMGASGMAGIESDILHRASLRFQLGYRYILLKHRVVSPPLWPTVSFQEEAKQDVIFSIGVVLRQPGAR